MGFVDLATSVLPCVELIVMNVYELRADGRPLLAVEIDTVPWLPVRPKLRQGWLRFIISSALKRHFRQTAAVVTA